MLERWTTQFSLFFWGGQNCVPCVVLSMTMVSKSTLEIYFSGISKNHKFYLSLSMVTGVKLYTLIWLRSFFFTFSLLSIPLPLNFILYSHGNVRLMSKNKKKVKEKILMTNLQKFNNLKYWRHLEFEIVLGNRFRVRLWLLWVIEAF